MNIAGIVMGPIMGQSAGYYIKHRPISPHLSKKIKKDKNRNKLKY